MNLTDLSLLLELTEKELLEALDRRFQADRFPSDDSQAASAIDPVPPEPETQQNLGSFAATPFPDPIQ